MPREYAKNWFSTWSDDDFCRQPVFDKLFYVVLCGQRGVNNAGVVAINFPRWRKAMRDGDRTPTERDLKEALRRMEKQRTIFVDEDAGELLIRSHMRRDELDKQPNVLLSGLRFLAAFDSMKFARIMAAELDRIELPVINSEKPYAKQLRANLASAAEAARTHLASLSEGYQEPLPEPFSEDFPEPSPRPGEMRINGEPFLEGSREPPVEVEVEVEVESLSGGYLSNERKEPPYPPSSESLTSHLPARRSNNGAGLARAEFSKIPSRSVGAYRIAEAFSASLPTPIETDLLSGIGVQIDKCLRRGIPAPAIANGLKAWTDSDSWSPTQIPNFVHKANNRSNTSRPTQKAVDYDSALTELLQEVQTL